MKKRIVSFLTAFVMAVTSSFSVAAEELGRSNISLQAALLDASDNVINRIVADYIDAYPQYEYEITDTVNIIMATDNYRCLYDFNIDEAYQLIRENLDFLIEVNQESYIETQSIRNNIYMSDFTVPIIKQSKGYNCGIAAALQALIGDGVLSNSTSNKNAAKQQALENEIDSFFPKPYSSQEAPYMLEYILNQYSNNKYTNLVVTIYTKDAMIQNMRDSLAAGYCPVVLVDDTSYLSYYNGHSYSHYVTVSQINDNGHIAVLVDPFNSDVCGGQSSFGGIHNATFDELMNGIGTMNGWVICYKK